MMEVRHIGKAFGKNAVLSDISLEVPQGKTLAVLGKSGCGKTTLLRIIAGLEHSDTGECWLDGNNVENVPVHRRNAVYINQEPLLFPHMKVRDNICYGLKSRNIPSPEITKRTDEMVRQLGLKGHENKWPHQLSGGQRQRVSFGRAIIVQPAVLLLDEPFGNLDTDTRKQMQDLFLELSRTYQITSLFVTHDLKEAILVGNKTAYMDKGLLHHYNTTEEFLSDPKTGGQQEIQFWQNHIQKK